MRISGAIIMPAGWFILINGIELVSGFIALKWCKPASEWFVVVQGMKIPACSGDREEEIGEA
jgi:hypothetical protein